jgi:AcrR family transcriptional regulator
MVRSTYFIHSVSFAMRKPVDIGEPEAVDQRRRRGPSRKLDAAITAATLRLLAQSGPSGVTIDAVARAVGCSRSSIYRRHASKEGLILEAALSGFGSPRAPEDGSLLEWVTRSRATSFGEPAFVLALTVLMDEALRGTDLGRRYLEEVFGPVRLERTGFLAQAIANREIRSDTDIDLILDIVTGALLFRAAHHPEPEDDLPERLTSILLHGVGARASDPPDDGGSQG